MKRKRRNRKHRQERRYIALFAMSVSACMAFTALEFNAAVAAVDTTSISPEPVPYYVEEYASGLSHEAAARLAQTIYGEARGVSTTAEKAAVVWCILNRLDDPRWPNTIESVCTPSQFHGYDPANPIDPELYALAKDVYARYEREKAGEINVGRVLPREYVFFHGDGKTNWFRTEYQSPVGYWDWSLPSPYDEGGFAYE